MAKKSEALVKYKEYEAWMRTQHQKPILIFGADRGGEFMSKEFNDHLAAQGTICHLTTHDSPQSNGGSEHINRTILDMGRAMLLRAKLPCNLWAEVINHAFWLKDRLRHRGLKDDKTPFEVSTGLKPDLSRVPEWGAKVWVKDLDAGKLDARAKEGRFVGYDGASKGYRIYWEDKRRVSVEQDVVFNKDKVFEPGTVLIEGETDLPDFLDFNPTVPATPLPPKSPSPEPPKSPLLTEPSPPSTPRQSPEPEPEPEPIPEGRPK